METIVLSFSGGRTSAYMTKYMLDNYQDKYNFIVIYANTGQEHPKTLDFIHNCDTQFNFNTVWIEAVVHHGQRKGNTAKIVTYETADREGKPFEEVIKKHGVPNKSFPVCTRELKQRPIMSYMRSLGYKPRQYKIALGIRADETRRVSTSARQNNVIYPLVDAGVEKEMILDWWKEQPFDLEILEHQGNCTWCWKKSDRKHFLNIEENPSWYEFPKRMEKLYCYVGPQSDKTIPRNFFRFNRDTETMFKLYQLSKDNIIPISQIEHGAGCSESCELYPMEEI